MKAASAFDPVQNKLFFSLNNKSFESVPIVASTNNVNLNKVFSFKGDKDRIYYNGEFYGNFYEYNLKTQVATLLGSTGYNLYSTLSINDSIMYLGGYPNGFLMKWNRNLPWTTNKFLNGKMIAATDSAANPRIEGFWKSQGNPPAGFHHTAKIILDNYGNLVGAGNVIRIGNGASIGGYNIAKDSLYGVAYDAYSGMGYRDICAWRKLTIYSMANQFGKNPRLYFYDSRINKMVDSLDLGYADYGKIFVQGDVLFGVANDRVYKINLPEKKVLEVHQYPPKSISNQFFLSNGTLILTTKNEVPPSFCKTVQLNFRDYFQTEGYVYAINGNKLVRITGLKKKGT